MLTRESNCDLRFHEKSQLVYGEYLTIIEKQLSVPRVHTAALIKS